MTTEPTPAPEAGRLSSWLAGWRVALRMARRDVRHHRGRSLLVVVMVGLPVLLLTAGSTVWFTDDLNRVERLPFQLGQAQAYLNDPWDVAFRQDPLEPRSSRVISGEEERAATPIPGYGPGTEQTALEALVHGDLVPVTETTGSARVDGHWVPVGIVSTDGDRYGEVLAPTVSLISGRWPRTPDEVVVTPSGIADGLPASGDFHLVSGWDPDSSRASDVTVVGVGTAFRDTGAGMEPLSLVSSPAPAASDGGRRWLVLRDEPLSWDEVQRLNEYGIGALSRDVVENLAALSDAPGMAQDTDEGTATTAVVAAATGLLLLTVLLAGPAFAVSAARQRRSLALAATNGATTPQLRRVVLAQALVLGAVSALVGAGLGVLGGVGVALVTRAVRPDLLFGPVEVPWPAVALVAAAAVVSTVVAALVPARGLGRLDLVPVLRGQSVARPARRRTPALGLVLAASSAVAVVVGSTWISRAQVWPVWLFVAGSVGLVIGALLLAPMLLTLGARAGGRLPLPLRMATRDADRQRARTIPTVAAILGAAAVLAAAAVANEAATVRFARDYQEWTLPGTARLETGPLGSGHFDDADLAELAVGGHPEVTPVVLHRLGDGAPDAPNVQLVAQRPGCTLADTLPPPDVYSRDPSPKQSPTNPDCLTLSTSPIFLRGGNLVATDPDALTEVMGLDEAQRRALENGAVAILAPAEAAGLGPVRSWDAPMSATAVDELRPVTVDVDAKGMVTFARYVRTFDGPGRELPPDPASMTSVRMPTVLLTHDQWEKLAVTPYDGYGAVMSTTVAQEMGLNPTPFFALFTAPGGIDVATEGALNDTLRAEFPHAQVIVERGYQRSDTTMLIVLFTVIGLIMLVATLIATALGQAENAALLGTLAAVGATRRTRRALAAGQAAYLGLLGAVTGVLVGLVPGVAVARVITADHAGPTPDFSGSVAPVPWAYLVPTVLAVGLVAAALAWVAVRRAPTVTRRTT